MTPIDHDALFKKLLTTFFVEFAIAFLPAVAEYMDFTSIRPLCISPQNAANPISLRRLMQEVY